MQPFLFTDVAEKKRIFWLLLITFVHVSIWFLHYGNTALGESPALDNRQILELAHQMADGALAPEPFHRAPLYPYLLSRLLWVGVPFEILPLVARWINGLCLLVAVFSVTMAANRLWSSPWAAWFSGLLVGLNPVLLFFAGDAFDILFATAILSLSLLWILLWLKEPNRWGTLGLGLLLALGGAIRSHLLPLALLWPIYASILCRKRRVIHAILASVGLFLSFALLGIANMHTCGEFRVMPWQSAYNLYAGNGPHASGRIYTQLMDVNFGKSDRYDNPAKLESIALYEQRTGKQPPHSVSEMNAYWKAETLHYVVSHPLQWGSLIMKKAYYFLNNYEQYDNKTYGFHKKMHTQLRINPMHWGLLMLLAIPSILVCRSAFHQRLAVLTYVGVFVFYAAVTILFYTSNRFRVPMIPLLSVLAGGIVWLPSAWRRSNSISKTSLLMVILLTGGCVYSSFFDANNPNTWEEDYALLANASLRTGRDADAIKWGTKALEMNPLRADMKATLVQARFNQWAFSTPPVSLEKEVCETLLEEALALGDGSPEVLPIVGIYQWKLGNCQASVMAWNAARDSDPFALMCLVWTHQLPLPGEEILMQYGNHKNMPLLKVALAARENPSAFTEIVRVLQTVFETIDEIQPPG